MARFRILCLLLLLVAAPAAVAEESPQTALDLLIEEQPGVVESLSPLEKRVLQALTPEQASLYLDDTDPTTITLASGETLAELVAQVERELRTGLVFKPVEPCVIMDTLKAGRLIAGESRTILVRGERADYSDWGGSEGGCGIPGLTGDGLLRNAAQAVFLNIEVFDPEGEGELRIWPSNDRPAPSVGLLSYGPFRESSTSVIVSLCNERGIDPCADGDLTIEARDAGVGIAVKVMGYFEYAGNVMEVTSDDSKEIKSTTSPFWEEGGSAGAIHYSDGNVGIGTTVPLTPFAIKGNGGVNPVGITQNQVGGDSTMELTTKDLAGSQATRLLLRGDSDNANIVFYRGGRGSEEVTMFIKGNGNVGIGTAAPWAKLMIEGPTNSYPNNKALFIKAPGESTSFKDQIMISSPIDTGYGIAFGGQGHHRGGIYARSVGGTGDATGEIAIWSRKDGNILLKGGAVGIGTTAPSTPLAIRGNGGENPVGITQNQVGGGATMELTTMDVAGAQATRLLFRGGGDNADIEFYRGARGSEEVTVFIEGTNGNMGIGTAAPGERLEVDGNVKLSGSIVSDGDICIGKCE